VIEFAFGRGSRARHLAAAADQGAVSLEVDGPLTLDVDTPEDLLLAEVAASPAEHG
jgi:2-phospho-L-lactate guanylyltransferase (CobY/MobA/RfbA family)